MKNQMTSRDYELISAYLDNQLGNQERERLEARLKIDPVLQKELNELSQTRSLLHNMPKIRAPRNYYINAQSVSKTAESRPLMQVGTCDGDRFSVCYNLAGAGDLW